MTDIATLGVQEANKVGISHGHAPIGAHEPDAPRSTAQLRQSDRHLPHAPDADGAHDHHHCYHN